MRLSPADVAAISAILGSGVEPLQFSAMAPLPKQPKQYAEEAAAAIRQHGAATALKDHPNVPWIAHTMRKHGFHDEAKLADEHHTQLQQAAAAAKAEEARKNIAAQEAAKAAAPKPALPPVPGYVGHFDPKARRAAITAFVSHPGVSDVVSYHNVNAPGIDKKEALKRAEAAYEAYHANQARMQPQQGPQPSPFPDAQQPSGEPATRQGRQKLSQADKQQIAARMGLIGSPPVDPNWRRQGVERAEAPQPTQKEEPKPSSPAVSREQLDSIRSPQDLVRAAHDKRGEGFGFAGYNPSRTPVNLNDLQSRGHSLGDIALHYLSSHGGWGQSGGPSTPANVAAAQKAFQAFRAHLNDADEQYAREQFGDGKTPTTTGWMGQALGEEWNQKHGSVGENPDAVNQDAFNRMLDDEDGDAQRKRDEEYAREQFGDGKTPTTTGWMGQGYSDAWKEKNGLGYVSPNDSGFADAIRRFEQHPEGQEALKEAGVYEEGISPAEMQRRGIAAYNAYHGKAGQAEKPTTAQRFRSMLAAAKDGTLRQKLEGGLGKFFDKYDQVGYKMLKPIVGESGIAPSSAPPPKAHQWADAIMAGHTAPAQHAPKILRALLAAGRNDAAAVLQEQMKKKQFSRQMNLPLDGLPAGERAPLTDQQKRVLKYHMNMLSASDRDPRDRQTGGGFAPSDRADAINLAASQSPTEDHYRQMAQILSRHLNQIPATHHKAILDIAEHPPEDVHTERHTGDIHQDVLNRAGSRPLRLLGAKDIHRPAIESLKESGATPRYYNNQWHVSHTGADRQKLIGGLKKLYDQGVQAFSRDEIEAIDALLFSRKSAAGQLSFDWDEDSHPREEKAHDNKRPGEFAPKRKKPSSMEEADARVAASGMRREVLGLMDDEKEHAARKERVQNWRQRYADPKESIASGDLSRHDWEKATLNGVPSERLSQMVDEGVEHGAIDAGVGRHLKSKFATPASTDAKADDVSKQIADASRLIASVGRTLGRKGADLDDFIADTQLKAIRFKDKFDPSKGSFATWITTVATNVARSSHDKSSRRDRRAKTVSIDASQDGETRIADTLADKSARPGYDPDGVARVRAEVAKLPEHQRSILESVVNGEQIVDIAARLGVSKQAVSQHLQRISARIRDGLGAIEFARKPAAGQRSFNWDEDSHPREKAAHDGKRPGEFAPKDEEVPEQSPVAPHLMARKDWHRQEKSKPGYEVSKANREYWASVTAALANGEEVHPEAREQYASIVGQMPTPKGKQEPLADQTENTEFTDIADEEVQPESRDDHPSEAPQGESQAPNWEKLKEVAGDVEDPEAPPPDDGEYGQIRDIGEKIGGARKDTARKLGKRTARESSGDKQPTWMRNWMAAQVSDGPNKGKWALIDTKTGRSPLSRMYFNDQESALKMAPIAEVAKRHRAINLAKSDEPENFAVIRDVSDRKRPVIKDGFATHEDAMRYMLEHAAEILSTPTRITDAIHPQLEEITRTGLPRRPNGRNATEKDYMALGFRGVEFGKWVNNAEGHHILNHAYDSMLDMADVLGIPPRALSLDGELALGFGSRGKGNTGWGGAARAHYERDYGVINMTKIKGAGSLAHEWMHAFDHWLGRNSGKAKNTKVVNSSGDEIFQKGERSDDYVSHGFNRNKKEGFRAEVAEAFDAVMDAIKNREMKYKEDQSLHERRHKARTEALAEQLSKFRAEMARDYSKEQYQYYKGKRGLPASDEVMKQVDDLIQQLSSGDYGENIWHGASPDGTPVRGRDYSMGHSMPANVAKLSDLHKQLRGNRGYAVTSGQMRGIIADIKSAVMMHRTGHAALKDAQEQKEKTGKVRSEFMSQAERLDSGQKKDYWSTPHEMAARAFESYIYDKIKEKGGRNDYLSYEKHNNLPQYRMFNVKPYPEGDERAKINAAFDKLFSVMSKHELDGEHRSKVVKPRRDVVDDGTWKGHLESTGQDPEFIRRIENMVSGREGVLHLHYAKGVPSKVSFYDSRSLSRTWPNQSTEEHAEKIKSQKKGGRTFAVKAKQQFSRQELYEAIKTLLPGVEFARKPAAGQLGMFADEEISAATSPSSKTRTLKKRKPAEGQKTFWNEDEHPREEKAHDNKRPGEFAPKGAAAKGVEEEYPSLKTEGKPELPQETRDRVKQSVEDYAERKTDVPYLSGTPEDMKSQKSIFEDIRRIRDAAKSRPSETALNGHQDQTPPVTKEIAEKYPSLAEPEGMSYKGHSIDAKTSEGESGDVQHYAHWKREGSWQAGTTKPHATREEAIAGAKAMIDEQEPQSDQGSTPEPETGEAPSSTPEKSPATAQPEVFDPETHGGYKPLLQLAKRIKAGELSADEYKYQFAFWSANEDAFLADLNKRFNATQMKNLASNISGWPGPTKSENAKKVHQSLMANAFLLDGGLTVDYMRGESYMDALAKHVAKQTDDSFSNRKVEAAQKSEEEKKAIENPTTIADFNAAIRHHGGYEKLPEAHQAAYDELMASTRRERDAVQKKTVTGFSGGTEATGATSIVVGHHQKKGVPTYTVTIEKHLGDGWDDVLSRARQLGGNYVNGRVARMYRATPGFQFFDQSAAEKFQKTLGGDEVDRSDILDERSVAKIDNASDRLSAMAELTRQRAQQELDRPRQANTTRRAEAAAYAEATARRAIAKANTMQAISEGLKSGSLKHLNGIRSATHIDSLDSILSLAKYRAFQKGSDNSHRSYEEMKGRDAQPSDVVHAEYPYPSIWDHDLHGHLETLAEVPGLKKLAASLKRSTSTSPFKKKIGNIPISGGKVMMAQDLSNHVGIESFIGDKAVRLHATTDQNVLRGRHEIAYTADSGKTWGTTPDIAVNAAIAQIINGGAKKGSLDIVDPPEHKHIKISDPETINELKTAVQKLKRKGDPRLRRIGESLGMHLEDYNRLQAMDIKTPSELRAALREYIPLKKRQDAADPVKSAERKLVGQKIDGFFPTPRPVIDRMLAAADIEPGMSVLEPSAGKGDILDAIKDQHPEANSVAIEPHSSLRDLIQMKGHQLHDDTDFLSHSGQYDRIVMNPPFEKRQDVAHVRHAYNQLKPGGRMVAIMSAGPFGGSSAKDQEFRDWLDSIGADVEEMPEGSFAGDDAFRKTGVNTRMVVISKPQSTSFSRDLEPAMLVLLGDGYSIQA